VALEGATARWVKAEERRGRTEGESGNDPREAMVLIFWIRKLEKGKRKRETRKAMAWMRSGKGTCLPPAAHRPPHRYWDTWAASLQRSAQLDLPQWLLYVVGF